MMDLLPPLTVTFSGIIAMPVLWRAEDGFSSFMSALAMLQRTGGPVSSSILDYQRRLWTPLEGRYTGWMDAFWCNWRPCKFFLWGQFREMCWLDKQPKQSLFDVKNCILSEYGFHRSVGQSSKPKNVIR